MNVADLLEFSIPIYRYESEDDGIELIASAFGFRMEDSRFLITAAHVVGAKPLTDFVYRAGGKFQRFCATMSEKRDIGGGKLCASTTSPSLDIAVFELNEGDGLKLATEFRFSTQDTLASSSPTPGTICVAIGFPRGRNKWAKSTNTVPSTAFAFAFESIDPAASSLLGVTRATHILGKMDRLHGYKYPGTTHSTTVTHPDRMSGSPVFELIGGNDVDGFQTARLLGVATEYFESQGLICSAFIGQAIAMIQ